VFAEAGTGYDIASLIETVLASDVYETGADWARLSNAELDFLVEVRLFEEVSQDTAIGTT